MKRPKLTRDAFKKKKFDTGNLLRIKEAVYDCARSYGLAAVIELCNSEFYPDANAKLKAMKKNGNHNDVLYNAFKKWVDRWMFQEYFVQVLFKNVHVLWACP